jgi:hypothetical protein
MKSVDPSIPSESRRKTDERSYQRKPSSILTDAAQLGSTLSVVIIDGVVPQKPKLKFSFGNRLAILTGCGSNAFAYYWRSPTG